MRFCASKTAVLLLLCISVSSCDLFRRIAGRPTSSDIEKKRAAIEMEQKAHNDRIDSLKTVQRQLSDSLATLDSIRILNSSLVEARQLSDEERSRLPHAYYIVVGAFSNQDNAAGKRRTYYRITEAGRAYYQQKCEEWLLTQEVVEKFIIKGDSINGND